MQGNLAVRALAKFLSGLILMGLLLFVPAGTLDFWQAWLLLGALFIPMLIAGAALLVRAPALLEKRLSARETQGEQRVVVLLSGMMFLVAFLLAGLNRRLGWPMLPGAASWAAAGVFLIGYGLYAEVLRENAWLSRTVEVQDGQRVVDTGLYGVVRHPMYTSTLLMFLSMPLVLGCVPSFIVMLGYVPILVLRIRNEEAVLERGLAGYADYERRVRWRLLPRIW